MKSKQLQQAIDILKEGGIVIYPTDTAFGIGCRIDRPESVDRLFRIRKRPTTQATPVLVDSQDMAIPYLDSPSQIVRRLMEKHWPGGLTIVASCKKNLVYSPIRGGGNTIGFRMPDHETTLTLIRAIAVPIMGPSANFHGDPTPYDKTQLDPELVKLVDYVVPGECTVKPASPAGRQASTVVDCSVDPLKIIRQGAVHI